VKRALLVLAALLLLAVPVSAQVQYGSVSGTVVDNDGVALPGVTVTLAGPAMQGERVAITDVNGLYRFAPVPPGADYTLKFELSGFNTLERSGLNVNIGKNTAVDAQMSLSQFAETISVVADRVVVDTSKSTVDTTVDWQLVDDLVTNRTFQTMMYMAPGVGGNQNNPLVNGGSNDSNQYLVDGVDTTDPRVQTWGTTVNWDTIAEAQLQTGGFAAEYGRATGGILNLVTKSGGNAFSVTGRLVKSKAGWSAKSGIDDETGRTKTGGSRSDEERPSITVGGPLIKDALWFYVAYERRDNSRGYTWYASSADVAEGNQLDGRTSYAGHYFSGKLTWQLNPNHNIIGYYVEDPITLSPLERGWNDASYGTATSPDAEHEQFQGGPTISLQWTGVLSPRVFLEAKAQRVHQELTGTPTGVSWSEGIPYITDLDTYYQYGAPSDKYQSKRYRDGLQAAGNYFLDARSGSHQLKAGAEIMKLKPDQGTIHNPAGYYYILGGEPSYRDIWLDETGPVRTDEDYYALYVQDQWRIGKLTLNLGVRAEQTELFNNKRDSVLKFSFGDQFAPRLGFAYDLNGDAVRGSIGRFYQFTSNYIADYFNVFSDHTQRWYWNGSCTVTGNVWETPDECWDLAWDNPVGGGNAAIDPHLKPNAVDELTLGYDKRISDLMAGSLTFVWREENNLIDIYDPEVTGFNYYTNIPRAAREYVGDKKAMEHQSLQLSLRKRYGPDRFQFLTSYTYVLKDRSWAGAYGGFWRNSIYYQFWNPDRLTPLWYGRDELTPVHSFKFDGSYTLPWRTIIGLSGYWNSGNHYTPYTWGPPSTGWSSVPTARRSSLDVGNNWEANLYLEQPFRFGPVELGVYANVINAFNNQQPTNRRGNVDLASFKTPSAWQNPRRVELGFKVAY
jgi:hypothetical protein